MHIVVAPDSFKGTASAPEAAASIAMGVRQALPDATVTTLPMADGGEGTVQSLVDATGGRILPVEVTGVLGSLAGIAEIAKATFGPDGRTPSSTPGAASAPRRPTVPTTT